jgi:nickel/cobalt transporter (NicO) family protein
MSTSKQIRLLAAIAAWTLTLPTIASAHPMGNFSINHYSKIIVEAGAVRVDYIIDMAEIPTFQEIQRSGINARTDDPTLLDYLHAQSASLAQGLSLTVGSRPIRLEVISRHAIFPPGAGGLPTMKLGFTYQAKLPASAGGTPWSIHYEDNNFPGHAGWKEIVAISGAEAHTLTSSVPDQDRSQELSNYPTDLLHSPPQVLEADVSFAPGPPVRPADVAKADTGSSASEDLTPDLRLAANRQQTPRNAFTELIKSTRLDLRFLLTAALIAAVLGGFHALEPGHGKTLVAAYLVGAHGKARHAVMLGGIVTASHTISVYALGLITLYASQRIMPEQLYPWVGIGSGSLVAGLGFTLFLRRYLADDHPNDVHHHMNDLASFGHDHRTAHSHTRQGHEQSELVHRHNWWGGNIHEEHAPVRFGLEHAPREHPHRDVIASNENGESGECVAKLSAKSLFALGITGGIVPCPAALVVLLGALAFHRILFGLFLIVAFSAGLAAVLISLGLVMVFAGNLVSRFGSTGPLTERWLPLASSAVITVIGVALTLQSLVIVGVLKSST